MREQRLEELARQKIVNAKRILNYGSFWSTATPTTNAPSPASAGHAKRGVVTTAAPASAQAAPAPATTLAMGDVEDLFAVKDYLALFNATLTRPSRQNSAAER